MRYQVVVSRVQVIGYIWMPNALCAQDYTISSHDVENMRGDGGSITRDDLENWIGTHCGDFQSIKDFAAEIEICDDTLTFPWADEESELTYNDCMFSEEDWS